MEATLTPDEIIERSFGDYFWVPEDVTVVDRPEIIYYSCPRDVGYLNMVTRIRAGADQVAGLIEEVLAAHRGRRSTWVVPSNDRNRDLERRLLEASYSSHEYRVCTAPVDEYSCARENTEIVVRVIDGMERLRDAVWVGARAFGEPADITDAQFESDLRLCTGAEPRVYRFVAYEKRTERPVCTGNMTLFRDHAFAFFWGGGTVPEARRRGFYSAVLTARVGLARNLGISTVGMCARSDTSAPIVTRFGFRPSGVFHLWDRVA